MFKMDTHTRSVFLSGVFVYVSTITGLVWNYSTMQENHEVRIGHLEIASIQSGVGLKQLAAEVGVVQTKSAAIEVMLVTINNSVQQLNKTTTELGKIAARLDERSKG